jgi:DNA-binding XRE family transcriptional regulator
MKLRNYRELQNAMSPERQAKNAAATERMVSEMPLDELRAAREMTQENLARVLGVRQATISKMERQTDMYVSTLAKFIEAMGGELEIRAKFREGSVLITQFGEEK